MRRAPLVSRLATFRLFVGWRAWACGALACVYVPECGGCRAGMRLKVAVCDTAFAERAGGLRCGCVCWGGG